MPRLSPTRPVTDGEAEPEVVAVSDDTEANDDEERRSRSSGSLSSSGAASSAAGNAWRRVPTGSRRRGDNEYHNMKSPARSDARSAPSSSSPSTLSSLMSVQRTPAWQRWVDAGRERVDIVIDSGSSASMLPVHVAPKHVMHPGANKVYTSASKVKVQELGTKQLRLGLQD